MDALVSGVANAAGIDASRARKAVAILLKILNRDGPRDATRQLIDALPGGRSLIASQGESGASSYWGGFSDVTSGGMGVMGALGEMTEAGLDMGQVQIVTRQVIAYARTRAGDELVDQVVDGIPGLRKFV
ncbi:DUF2267 domain-containing protein [Rhizobiales bacterium]|uniref:DUF2267 domain-containing protein n=1 Tax=Hongsoonwoonella zoysiae TaxID=2821844 RepID=UPI001560D947|nr:DUF2267 domain-containing protein [Hongsoonwoonella zoysiae]NRG19444.1 DUF2267 domain-containing protein [Hongsoonwoonella zoysiae]